MKLAVALIAGLGLAGTARAAEFGSESTRASKLHPRLILAPRANAARATLRIQFRAGSFDDGFRSGLTHLAQQAVIGSNAVESYEKLALDLYAANATLELETGVRESSFTLTAPRREFPQLAKRVLNLVLAPRIVEAHLEEVKSRTLQSHDTATFSVLASFLARSIFTGDGWGNDPHGDKDAIRNLGANDIAQHLRTALSPANATVIAAGGFNAGEMKSWVARFKGGQAKEKQRPKGELAGDYRQRSGLEFHLLALPIALDTPRSVAAAHLLGAVLEERILRQFRKLGIAYSSMAAPVHREWLDAIIVALPIRSDAAVSVNANLARELAEVRGGTFLRDELERNRAHLLEHFRDVDRDSDALADALAMGAGDLEWFGPKVAAEIGAMSREDFLAAIAPWLDPAASIHVELSPRTGAKGGRR